MEDSLPRTLEPRFTCPGQTRSIERAVHLSRLAAFDPACLTCPQRHDTQGLSPLAIAARAEVERRASSGWQWTAEAAVTSERGQLDSTFPRQFAFALADLLVCAEPKQPIVHVGASRSPRASELLAVVCRALELAGCDVYEVGPVTAPCLSAGIAQAGADGGIWIGNASGRQHELALLALGHGGVPWSAPGRLDEVRSAVAAGAVRPRRCGGNLHRFDAAAGYLPLLTGAFHGLRALEFVLHTASRSLPEYLDWLCRETALRVTRLDEHRPAATAQSDAEPAPDPLAAELAAVAGEVVLSGAHFGFWVDGAGERCVLIDERGEIVPHDRLARLLDRATAAVGCEPETARGAPVRATREQLGQRSLAGSAAQALADGDGRYWLAEQAAPDALAVLCVVLTTLSRSDWPLSAVLDAAPPA